MIPISRVRFDSDDEQAVLEVLRSGSLAQGVKVEELESACSALIGSPNVVAFSNGTTALLGALAAAGVGPNVDVVTTAFTFAATANAALTLGATVHLVDISLDDFAIDLNQAASVIRGQDCVLMPVHLYGQPGDLGAMRKICEATNVRLVEDAAQAIGAGASGIGVGTLDLAAFSLYATKNITTGEGGLVTATSDRDADFLRRFRNQGMGKRYEYEIIGLNYRLTDLAAVLGLGQVSRYHSTVARRSLIASRYHQAFADISGIRLPSCCDSREHVWHQFTVLLEGRLVNERNRIVEDMNSMGVSCGIYYPKAISEYRLFASHPRVKVVEDSKSRMAARTCLSLPISHHLSDQEVESVIAAFRRVAA